MKQNATVLQFVKQDDKKEYKAEGNGHNRAAGVSKSGQRSKAQDLVA
jgi:hypothetical protein